MTVDIRTIESMPFAENSYVLHVPGRNDCIVVDPGFEPDLILEYLTDESLKPAAILNTHGHVDHIAGNQAIKESFPDAPLIIGEGEADFLTDADLNLSGPYGIPITSPPADKLVKHGETIEYAGMTFEVRFAPGHSPGHVVFVVHGAKMVIGGDVLFRDSIGRHDFPGGSIEILAQSIRTQLYTLPDDTTVYPGHGPTTKIGYEKGNNPFVRG